MFTIFSTCNSVVVQLVKGLRWWMGWRRVKTIGHVKVVGKKGWMVFVAVGTVGCCQWVRVMVGALWGGMGWIRFCNC